MQLTIHKLAKLAGVSVRTLHFYDEKGLLKPSFVKKNGYRVYEEKELRRLQQILFFKELEFPLEKIIEVMNNSQFDRVKALEEQKEMLQLKRKRFEGLLQTIEKTIEMEKGGEKMKNDDLFKSFGDEELVKHQEEAYDRWGNTNAYKQSMQKVKNWTKADYDRIKKEGVEFTKKLAEAMDLEISSPEVQELVKQHHAGIEYFYTCSPEMYRNLAQMYVDDPRFTKYYDKHRPGLAVWLRDAINFYCDEQEKK